MSGLRRATLATIETRSWSVRPFVLTGAEVVALYRAIPDRTAMHAAVRGPSGFDSQSRRYDRALKVLKAAGLVRYAKGQWHRTADEP